jgi:hypothetical protein
MRSKPLCLVASMISSLLFAFSGYSADQVRQIMRQDDDFSSANEIREGETIVKLSSHPDNTGDYYHINLSRPGLVTITLSAFPTEGTFRIGAMGFDASSPTSWISGTNEVESQPGAGSLQMKFVVTKGLSGYIRISFNTASGMCSGNFCALRLTSQGPWYLKPIRESPPAKFPADIDGIPLKPQLSYRLTINVGESGIGVPSLENSNPTRPEASKGNLPPSPPSSNTSGTHSGLLFEDNFQRPDASSLGPQWREYLLRNSQVQQGDSPWSVRNRELYFEVTGTNSYIEDFIETLDTFPVDNLRIEFELRGRVGTRQGYVGPTFLLSGDALQRTNSANVKSGPAHIGLHTSYRWEKQGQSGAVILANGSQVHDLPDAKIGGLNENEFQPHVIAIANNAITYTSPRIGTVTYPLDAPLAAGERRHFTIGTRVYDSGTTQVLEIRNIRIYSLTSSNDRLHKTAGNNPSSSSDVGPSTAISWTNEEKSIRERLASMTVALHNQDAGTLAALVVSEYRNSFQSRYNRDPQSFFSKSEPLGRAVLFYLSDKPTEGQIHYERMARLMTDDNGEMMFVDMVKQNGQWYFKNF